MAQDNFAENMLKIRTKFADLTRYGANNVESLQEILTSTLNECERFRTQAQNQSQSLQQEIRKLQGQSEAFQSMSTIIFMVLDNMVKAQEKQAQIDARNEEDRIEKERLIKEEKEKEDDAKPTKASRKSKET